MFIRQACNTLRMGLLRRSMATAGRRPETPNKMVSLDTLPAARPRSVQMLNTRLLYAYRASEAVSITLIKKNYKYTHT